MKVVPFFAELITITCLSIYPAVCGDPIPPANGSVVTFTSAAVGSQILYSCDQGFLPVELMNSTCASDMNWSPNPAEFTCREPGINPTDKALTNHSQWVYNTVYIHLSIVDNWILFSNAVSCSGPPLPPKNGSIGVYTGAIEGSVVAFFCNKGLIPDGQINTTCVSNGSWTPNPADLVCIEPPAEDEGLVYIHCIILHVLLLYILVRTIDLHTEIRPVARGGSRGFGRTPLVA